jgi:aminoglycoside phosphotransferase (APT) family kinase protein
MPTRLQSVVENWMKSPVADVADQFGGFSPGVAARLSMTDGRKVFIKAAGPELNPDTPALHRREAAVAARLPDGVPAPRLLFTHDEGGDGWIVMLFEDVDGRNPGMPWTNDDARRLVEGMQLLAVSLSPSPLEMQEVGTVADHFRASVCGWAELLAMGTRLQDEWAMRNLEKLAAIERLAPTATKGRSLIHFDIRADNVLLTRERVYFVDWPHARIGAPWVDLLGLAPSVAMQGGPELDELLGMYKMPAAVSREAITTVLASIAGYFVRSSLKPPPPGIPGVREFQAAQGAAAVRWLKARLG